MHCLVPGLLSVQGTGVAGGLSMWHLPERSRGPYWSGRGEGGHDVQEIKEIEVEGPCGGQGVPSGGQDGCEPGSAHAGMRWRCVRRAWMCGAGRASVRYGGDRP